MDFIFQFVFWLLTFVLGFVGFANVGLPVFYGIPQSISWFRAGSVRIGAVRGYFITCIIWSVLLTIAISIMYLIFSLFVDRIVTIGLAGAALGFLFGVFQSLTASGRESLRSDFHRAMSKHLNYDETNNNKSILAGRMDDTTLEREISIALVSDDFEQAAELGTQIVAQFLGEIPAVQLGKLGEYDRNVAPQFLSRRLWTAFMRGWRSGTPKAKLDSARNEIAIEVDFLLQHKPNDTLLILADRINDYFSDAVWLFAKTADRSAQLAALSAAIVAQDEQRTGMVSYLSALRADWESFAPELPEVVGRLDGLIDEIRSKNWKLEDAIAIKSKLEIEDPEYLFALNGFDPSIFRHRFPSIFKDYDTLYPPA